MGGPSRYGPFATYAEAKAFCDANKVGMTVISGGSDDVAQSQPDVDNSEAERRAQEEAERRREAEKKAAVEQAARDKAARDAAEARRFQKIREDATKQLKGFNPDNDLKLKGVSGGGVSGLKVAPKPTVATVNSDPMVVDLRNLSSGLPKSVDEAIPHTPAGNRIRKGFQAIARHDWDNALLWFKDAYNREPGDPGLQRLVDLAQYTLDSQARAQQPPVNTSPAIEAPQESANLVPANPASPAKPEATTEIPMTRDNVIARIAARTMAAEARVQEVYAELRKKYGPDIPFKVRYSLETNIKKEKAREGEGLSKEELNAQLEAALTEFLKTHKTYDSRGVGGSPTAEEIVLGGKG